MKLFLNQHLPFYTIVTSICQHDVLTRVNSKVILDFFLFYFVSFRTVHNNLGLNHHQSTYLALKGSYIHFRDCSNFWSHCHTCFHTINIALKILWKCSGEMLFQEGFKPIVQIATDDKLSLEKVDVFLLKYYYFSFLLQSFENILWIRQ